MADLEELAGRVEALAAPDRDVDYAIADAVLGPVKPPFRRGHCEKYSASIDAAMTLAEGFGGELTFFKDGTAKAFLWQPYPMAVEAKAASPALALTAAALRALSRTQGNPNG